VTTKIFKKRKLIDLLATQSANRKELDEAIQSELVNEDEVGPDVVLHAATPTFPYIKNPTTGITYTATETEDRSEVVTKGYYTDYVFPLFSQFTMKDAVRLVATTNVSLAPGAIGSLTIDGVVVTAFNRVLLAGQTNPAENGMYMYAVHDTSLPALDAIPPGVYVLARSYDGSYGSNYAFGNAVAVQDGVEYNRTVWFGSSNVILPDIFELGVDPLTYRQVGDFSDKINHAATPAVPSLIHPVTGIPFLAFQTPEEYTQVVTQGYLTDSILPLHDHRDTTRQAVRLVATSNVSLAPGLIGSLTIDGVVVTAFNRVLLAGQTNPAENGMYMYAVHDTSLPALDAIPPGVYVLARSYDGAYGFTYAFGNAVAVQDGNNHKNSWWYGTPSVLFPSTFALGTDALVYRKIGGHTTQEDSFVATSNQTVFTLSKGPSTTGSNIPKALYVYQNRQLVYRTEYTINTTTRDLTLATPATLSDVIYISYEV